ncbi:glycosyltransferase [Thermodesulfovibrio hydrogeniphilus]
MEKIKLLAIIDHLDGGGAERQFLNLVNNLNRELFDIYVFLTERKGKRFNELRNDVKINGLLESERRNTLKAILEIRRQITNINPHIIQTWLEYSTFLTAISSSLLNSQSLFVASHRVNMRELYDIDVNFGKFKKLLIVKAYKKTHYITTNCFALKKELEEYGVRNIEVIYNGFEVESLLKIQTKKKEIRQSLNLKNEHFYFIFCGSLVRRKGIQLLLEAFQQLNYPKSYLLILGDGELKREVIKASENDKRILYLGYVKNPIDYIKASDVLILPSFYEGMPNVLIEAMAVGTPVVGTKVDGIPELLDNGKYGILIESGKTEAILDAMNYAINNYAILKNLAEKAKERVKYFNIQRMVKEYENLYLNLLQIKSMGK